MRSASCATVGKKKPKPSRVKPHVKPRKTSTCWATSGIVLQDKRSPEAEQVYARILEMEPDDLHARKALARIKQKDEADESARLYTDILATDPDQGDVALQLNWMSSGTCSARVCTCPLGTLSRGSLPAWCMRSACAL